MYHYSSDTKNVIYSSINNVEADLISSKSFDVAERKYPAANLLT